MNSELLDRSQADVALRDLMPIIDHLAMVDNALHDGAKETAIVLFGEAVRMFRNISDQSPAVKAYTRWLDEKSVEMRRSEIRVVK